MRREGALPHDAGQDGDGGPLPLGDQRGGDRVGHGIDDRVAHVLAECLGAPLVRADGGELHVVAIEPDQLTLHLSGTCSGCPGVTLTTRSVIEPACGPRSSLASTFVAA